MSPKRLWQQEQGLSMFKLDVALSLRRESGHRVPLLTKKLSATVSYFIGKISFTQWSLTVYINHT